MLNVQKNTEWMEALTQAICRRFHSFHFSHVSISSVRTGNHAPGWCSSGIDSSSGLINQRVAKKDNKTIKTLTEVVRHDLKKAQFYTQFKHLHIYMPFITIFMVTILLKLFQNVFFTAITYEQYLTTNTALVWSVTTKCIFKLQI